MNYKNMIDEAVNFIKSKIKYKPEIAIILGSGLGDFVNSIKDKYEINYSDIPGFVTTTAIGHVGKFILGDIEGKKIIAMQGRFHLYEGYDVSQVVFPIRVLKLLGVNNLLITNAAGAANREFSAGDLMIIEDHISLFCPSPLRGANIEHLGCRFPDMSSVYDKDLIVLAESSAKKLKQNIRKGVYIYTKGPMFETPAEIRICQLFSADAVGMSTVPETIVARHMGMRILGLSLISNMAAGILIQPLTSEEVFETASKASKRFSTLLEQIIKDWR